MKVSEYLNEGHWEIQTARLRAVAEVYSRAFAVTETSAFSTKLHERKNLAHEAVKDFVALITEECPSFNDLVLES